MVTPQWPGTINIVIFTVVLCLLIACSSPSRPITVSTAPPSDAGLGDSWTRPVDEMVMVYVPAGTYEMGSAAGEVDEKPMHTVALQGFWIDRTEVTNAQYRECAKAGACEAPMTCEWGKPTFEDAATAGHPVVCVNWHGARAYCRWAGGRLPTEAEWEYAARGPQALAYPWGETFDCSRGNFDDETRIHDYVVPGGEGCDGYEKTAPAGSFPSGASWCGALDMAGNVREWVADWYGGYLPDAQSNPTGPPEGDFKVLKGGAWITFHDGERSAFRHRDVPDSSNRNAGFRCIFSSINSPS